MFFWGWEDGCTKFFLEEACNDFWVKLLEFYSMRTFSINLELNSHHMIGLVYIEIMMMSCLLKWFCVGYLKEFRIGSVPLSDDLMGTFPKSTLGLQYFTLTEKKPNVHNAAPPIVFSRWLSCIRVDMLTQGSAQTNSPYLDQFFAHPTHWCWPNYYFLAYSAKLGWKWIITQETLKKYSPTNGEIKFLLPSLHVGIRFGISTRLKRKRPSFVLLFTRRW